jgi:hypothetical protein
MEFANLHAVDAIPDGLELSVNNSHVMHDAHLMVNVKMALVSVRKDGMENTVHCVSTHHKKLLFLYPTLFLIAKFLFPSIDSRL